MAIDTASRRAAASTFGRLPVRVLPIPNGRINTSDRMYLLGCWYFSVSGSAVTEEVAFLKSVVIDYGMELIPYG